MRVSEPKNFKLKPLSLEREKERSVDVEVKREKFQQKIQKESFKISGPTNS